MELITKDYKSYECKFINFKEDGLTVVITLLDESEEEEEISNISYINW